ncbi:MAG: DNA-formamidopyrimidine glycosylase [Rhodospirillaceae bacterium]|nr:DNA-formamidopyrimidine glycosylase [Rhodospirillaceae bacterium]|tara:strand:- start:5211 stop:6044 length:834 start_codon:yes stop_codon:yes gene_type:complete
MPELPEVETVRRGLEPVLKGQVLTHVEQRRPDLRIPFPTGFVGLVEGRRVTQLRRKAKYLLFDLDDGQVLICHLGMSGRMTVLPCGSNQPPERHDHVVFTTEDGGAVVFNDHRRFGLMTLTTRDDEATHPLLVNLAPDPLEPVFDAAHLSERLKGKRTPIKAALLDQRVLSGVGNIYASEALNRSRISPRRLAQSVAGARAARLAPAIVDVLNEAIAAGGSSLRDHRQASGELGYFQHSFRVYDQEGEPCPTPDCHGIIRRIVQANRSTFFCGRCQR